MGLDSLCGMDGGQRLFFYLQFVVARLCGNFLWKLTTTLLKIVLLGSNLVFLFIFVPVELLSALADKGADGN